MSQLEASVVVPVYNSSDQLPALCDRLTTSLQCCCEDNYEILLIDDGSSSVETWPTISQLATQHPAVRGIRLMRNYGKPGAILCGLSEASGQWIITIDDDLQQLPEDLPFLWANREHDVVVAQYDRKVHGPMVKLTSQLKSVFDRKLLGLPCKMTPLKLIRREVAEGMLRFASPRPFIPALISKVTRDVVGVPCTHQSNAVAKSRYNFSRRLSQFLNLLIGNSSFLLRVLAVTGLAAAISGFAFAFFTVMRIVVGDPITPGWASSITVDLVFGGLILLGIGLNGEYLLRILENTNQQPAFIVRESTERQAKGRGSTGGE